MGKRSVSNASFQGSLNPTSRLKGDLLWGKGSDGLNASPVRFKERHAVVTIEKMRVPDRGRLEV